MPGLMPAGLEQTAQHGDQDVAGGRRAIQRMIDGLAARQGHEAAGQFLGGNGRRPRARTIVPAIARRSVAGPPSARRRPGRIPDCARPAVAARSRAVPGRHPCRNRAPSAPAPRRPCRSPGPPWPPSRDAFGFLRLVLAQQVQQQVFLALEIGVEGALGIAGLPGDIAHGGGCEAALGDLLAGRGDQALARLFLAFFSCQAGCGILNIDRYLD